MTCCHWDDGFEEGYEKGAKEAMELARLLYPDANLPDPSDVEAELRRQRKAAGRQMQLYKEAMAA